MTSNYSAIIPVPLHKTRRRERGYNQSEEIARALAKSLNLSLRSELLLRLRHTSTQTKKTRTEREENMQNAFSCPFQLKDEKVLLVDDVITTGSTVEACIRSLRQAGAGSVDVFAIAHPRETS
jgi:ComF family protein